MVLSEKTIDDILSHINELKDLYRRALPIACSKRLFFKKFLKNEEALHHATLLEQTFNLPFHLKDTGPLVLSTVMNMYLIETSPYRIGYKDFDWEEFKNTTYKAMKIVRAGGGADAEKKIRWMTKTIYRVEKKC